MELYSQKQVLVLGLQNFWIKQKWARKMTRTLWTSRRNPEISRNLPTSGHFSVTPKHNQNGLISSGFYCLYVPNHNTNIRITLSIINKKPNDVPWQKTKIFWQTNWQTSISLKTLPKSVIFIRNQTLWSL